MKSEVKTFEIRAAMTFIPVICVRGDMREIEESDRYLLRRGGWGHAQKFVYMVLVKGGKCEYNPCMWDSNTLAIAHYHIEDNWDNLDSGAVIDAEYIAGVTSEPKKSERHVANESVEAPLQSGGTGER